MVNKATNMMMGKLRSKDLTLNLDPQEFYILTEAARGMHAKTLDGVYARSDL
jgi:hypothetical protein